MSRRLVIDPVKCTGHAVCAELFPEWITLDDWGYPIVDRAPVPPAMHAHALRAVRACPAVALRLADDEAEPKARAAPRAVRDRSS